MNIELTVNSSQSKDHYFSGNELIIAPIKCKSKGLVLNLQNANGFTYRTPLNETNRTFKEDVSAFDTLWFTWSELEMDTTIEFEIN